MTTTITALTLVDDDGSLDRIWTQGTRRIPVIRRDTKDGEPQLRLPWSADRNNRVWLRNGRETTKATEPTIDASKTWTFPKAWFNDTVRRAIETFGAIYVIQPFNEREVCAPACQNATGHDCSCSCGGAHHGSGSDGSWFEVSATFAVRWHGRQLACRLMTAKD